MSNTLKVQFWRFARLFAVALVAQVALLAGKHVAIGWELIGATVIGAAEVAWRQFRPVPQPAPNATTPIPPPK